MAVRERIRKIKHLRNRYFICVLENPTDIANIGSAIRNISAFGVEKLYVIGGAKNILHDFNDKWAEHKIQIESVLPAWNEKKSKAAVSL